MGLICESGWTEILSFLVLIFWSLYWYLTKNYNYWEKRGVPNKKPQFPFGSTREILLGHTFIGKGHFDIYKTFPNDRFYGIIDFRKPSLILKDLELIKKIMVKDFQHFTDRPILMGNPNEYIVLDLVNLTGQEWKDMRAKLTPTFTSGKMKQMFALMERCSEVLKDKLDREVEEGKVVDMKDITGRFTMDIIATCAFGLETHSLNEDTEFYHVFKEAATTSKLRQIKRLIIMVFPFVMRLFRVNLIRPEVTDFVTNVVRDTIEYRQKNKIKRNDFLDLLINIKLNKEDWGKNIPSNTKHSNGSNMGLSIEQMAAQTFSFFVAGYDTASSLMAFCLYELACHQTIQEQLYIQIQQAVDSNGGKISYEVLMEIPFLDQIINETLRLYGTANNLSRICTKTYRIPDSDLVVEKGMRVVIPLYSLHHDAQYYPDPFEFKPERFTPEETKQRHPFVFMPFGEGPRNCIGTRFGLMQAKVGLSTIILNFQVQLSPEQEVPIEINRRSVPITPANPVLLRCNKRKI